MLRSTADWLMPGHRLFSQWPDIRLKMQTPEGLPADLNELESNVKGVEFRLPVDRQGIWVGWETPDGGEIPRATLSIQNQF